MFLEANDLRPQSVSFVGELSDSFSELVVVGDGSGGVGGIDETGVALTLPGAVRAHPFSIRCPLPWATGSCRHVHRTRSVTQ